jgi:hypothetical protein
MNESSNAKKNRRGGPRRAKFLIGIVLVLAAGLWVWHSLEPEDGQIKQEELADQDPNRIENGIHVRTGLIEDEGLMTVVAHCTACHSAQLVTQNRMNKERWNATIRWMQETQNLWDLGENQEIIVNYLVKNYPPEEKGRRENLKNIEWYDLKK